jgi:hypothetical protein
VSISTYTRNVTRLTSEVADLRGKLATERKKLADANAKALRAVEALGKATSTSQLSSRSRDVERYQNASAVLEKRAADLEKKLADKQRSLSSAQTNLERVQRDQQKKDDREAEKRRTADLNHIKAMERSRRQSTALPPRVQPHPGPPVVRPSRKSSKFSETFDVCLSFAGEQRDYVERIAVALKTAGLKVFYDQDKDIAASLWGSDLTETLDYVYREGSRFCVMFISTDYAEKSWTRHERRSALARALEEDEYVLPAVFDDTELPGFRPTIGYVDLREIAPATLVEFILKKLEVTPWPVVPDDQRWVLDLMDERLQETTQSPDELRARAEELRSEAERTEIDGFREAAISLAEHYEQAAARLASV